MKFVVLLALVGLASCRTALLGGDRARDVTIEYTFTNDQGKEVTVEVKADKLGLDLSKDDPTLSLKKLSSTTFASNVQSAKVEPDFRRARADERSHFVQVKPQPVPRTQVETKFVQVPVASVPRQPQRSVTRFVQTEPVRQEASAVHFLDTDLFESLQPRKKFLNFEEPSTPEFETTRFVKVGVPRTEFETRFVKVEEPKMPEFETTRFVKVEAPRQRIETKFVDFEEASRPEFETTRFAKVEAPRPEFETKFVKFEAPEPDFETHFVQVAAPKPKTVTHFVQAEQAPVRRPANPVQFVEVQHPARLASVSGASHFHVPRTVPSIHSAKVTNSFHVPRNIPSFQSSASAGVSRHRFSGSSGSQDEDNSAEK